MTITRLILPLMTLFMALLHTTRGPIRSGDFT
jgi:hypothetical protein